MSAEQAQAVSKDSRQSVRQGLRQATDSLTGVLSQMRAEGELPPVMRTLASTLVYTIGGLAFAEEQLARYDSMDDFAHDFDDELRVVETALAEMETSA